MRRLVDEETASGAALWSRRLGLLGVGLVVAAVAASRAGAVPPQAAMTILRAGIVLAGIALVAALMGAVSIWRTGRPGAGAMSGGIALALLALAGPAWFAVSTAGLPAIGDVSTATDGPAFSSAPAALARRRGATHPPVAADAAGARAAYPDLQPLTLDLDPGDAFAAARKLVKARRWAVVEAVAPKDPQGTGHIEAVARSKIMGFPCDVAIRVVGAGPGQSRVDIRSAARWDGADAGDAAARIAAFASDLEDAADE